MKKFLLAACSFLLFGALIGMLVVTGDKTGRIDIQIKGDSFFEGLRIVHKKSGEQQWLLTARRADLSRDNTLATLSGVEVKIPEKKITIVAEAGTYDMTSKHVSIEGPITAQDPNYTITTSGIEIDSEDSTLKTDQDVHLKGRRFTLSGNGLRLDKETEQVRILRNVKATFHK